MGKLDEADHERQLFYTFLHNGILGIAEAVLNGKVEYHKGNIQDAFKCLRLAVERDISLPYDEPWGWITPARHVLGALLLEQGETRRD